MDTDPIRLRYLPLGGKGEIYAGAIENFTHKKPGKDVILLKPVWEPYTHGDIGQLIWTFGAFAIGAVLFMLVLLAAPFNEQEYKRQLEKRGLP